MITTWFRCYWCNGEGFVKKNRCDICQSLGIIDYDKHWQNPLPEAVIRDLLKVSKFASKEIEEIIVALRRKNEIRKSCTDGT